MSLTNEQLADAREQHASNLYQVCAEINGEWDIGNDLGPDEPLDNNWVSEAIDGVVPEQDEGVEVDDERHGAITRRRWFYRTHLMPSDDFVENIRLAYFDAYPVLLYLGANAVLY